MLNSFLIINRNIFDDNHYRDKLDNNAILAYLLLGDRYKVSLKNHWYDHKYNELFIYYKVEDLAHDLRKSKGTAIKALEELQDVGLLKKRRMYKESNHLFLPKFAFRNPRKFNFKTTESSKSEPQSNNNSNNYTNNTVNTQVGKSKNKFKPASMIEMWENSVQKMGLTADTIDQIASFSSTYGQNAYKITGLIKEARDIIANHYHVTRKARRFENNQNVIDKLAKKLRKLFTYITTKGFKKAKLSNYAGFLVNSLKHFFKWAMCNKRDETVKPKTDNRHFRGYCKRKPIKEGKPQWMKDQEAGKKPKTKKTDKSLTRLIQARQSYDKVTMQADNPMKPNPDHDKIATLEKRVKHYEKLYNAKRKEAKPTPKPKQHKQSKKLPKTDPALQREIQARLRRLGEE